MQTRLVAYDRQLRSMSVQAALAEEQERQRIAVALHDKAGPLLATGYMTDDEGEAARIDKWKAASGDRNFRQKAIKLVGKGLPVSLAEGIGAT